jgi:hypothetical protein
MWRKGRLPVLGTGVWSSWSVWGSEVYLGRLAKFDGHVLRAVYGARWPTELNSVLRLPFLEVCGVNVDGAKHGLSGREELIGDGEGSAGLSSRAVSRRGRPPGSGLNAYVVHLRDHEGARDYGDVLQAVVASGKWQATVEAWGDFEVEQRRRLRSAYKSGRAANNRVCSYCERSKKMPLE